MSDTDTSKTHRTWVSERCLFFFFFFRFSDTAPTRFSGAGSDTYRSAVIHTALDTESYWSVPIISAGKEVRTGTNKKKKEKEKEEEDEKNGSMTHWLGA